MSSSSSDSNSTPGWEPEEHPGPAVAGPSWYMIDNGLPKHVPTTPLTGSPPTSENVEPSTPSVSHSATRLVSDIDSLTEWDSDASGEPEFRGMLEAGASSTQLSSMSSAGGNVSPLSNELSNASEGAATDEALQDKEAEHCAKRQKLATDLQN